MKDSKLFNVLDEFITMFISFFIPAILLLMIAISTLPHTPSEEECRFNYRHAHPDYVDTLCR